MGASDTFSIWDSTIHNTPDQKKRIKSAKSAKTTPSSVDTQKEEGIFPSSGATPYKTTLESCTCIDFISRKLPCKHIYRLAIELGMLNETAETGVNKNIFNASQLTLSEAVSVLENLRDEEQKIIQHCLMCALHQKVTEFSVIIDDSNAALRNCALLTPIDSFQIALRNLRRNQIMKILDGHGISGFKRNLSLEHLIAWCIENSSDVESAFSNIYTFRFSDDFQTAQKKVYSYLRRKYEWEFFYTEDMEKIKYPRGAKFEDVTIDISSDGTTQLSGNPHICHFPNDEITRLLTLFGHNRCLNGFDTSRQGNCD